MTFAVGIAAGGAVSSATASPPELETWLDERVAAARFGPPTLEGRLDIVETLMPTMTPTELSAFVEGIRRFPDHEGWRTAIDEHRRLQSGGDATVYTIWWPGDGAFRYSTTPGADGGRTTLDIALGYGGNAWSLSGGQLALLRADRPPPDRDVTVLKPMLQRTLNEVFHGPFVRAKGESTRVGSVARDDRSDSDWLVTFANDSGPRVVIGVDEVPDGYPRFRVVHWALPVSPDLVLPPGAPTPAAAFEVLASEMDGVLGDATYASVEGYDRSGRLVRRVDVLGFTPETASETRAALRAPRDGGTDALRGVVEVVQLDDFRDRSSDVDSVPIDAATPALPRSSGGGWWYAIFGVSAAASGGALIWLKMRR